MRRVTRTSDRRRRTRTAGRRSARVAATALVAGAAAVGTVLTAGAAAANPDARTGHSADRGPADPRDTTGWRHIDPRGYHHLETNQLRQNEIRDNRREYRRNNNAPQPPQRALGTDSGTTTWTAVPNPDGTGWQVCRPHATWC
ncbi:hypothetical protein [Nocardia blacklockiae]|uniref:hypothetical protein n=1 Tax=Nocardia blacklockiae TaxID=480036 RepID=UPI001894D94A|nr:hypothetical protein [Nocardia blacklockiae]MBF6176235.1 hypothetical protein [Nocardia blacklockiae]